MKLQNRTQILPYSTHPSALVLVSFLFPKPLQHPSAVGFSCSLSFVIAVAMPPLYILNETSVGYGLFKATDKKLLKRPNYADQLSSAEHVCRTLGLKGFQKWDSATQGIEEVQAVSEGKVTPLLSKLLEPLKDERKAALAVVDPKLGQSSFHLSQIKSNILHCILTTDFSRKCYQQAPWFPTRRLLRLHNARPLPCHARAHPLSPPPD